MNNYEEKYKQAFKKALDLYNQGLINSPFEHIFPELKESEDERIRKAILTGFIDCRDAPDMGWTNFGGVSIDKCIDWLEKQCNKIVDCHQNNQDVKHPNGGIVMADFNGGEGFYKLHLDYLNKKQVEEVEEMVRTWNKESKAANENIKNCIGMCLTDANEQRFKDYGTNLKDCLKWLEKPCEKNSCIGCTNDKGCVTCENGNLKETKAEPKFHEGDWVTNGDYTWKILEVKPLHYILQSQDGNIVDDTISYVDEHFHLWTIKDVKDGDVLVTTSIRNCPFVYRKTDHNNNLAYYYAGIDGNGDFCEGCLKRTLYHFGSVANVAPATKEQRDLLFERMKEAGYEWDTKLKKIEFNPDGLIEESCQQQADDLTDMVTKKSVWCEEDETCLEHCITAIKNYYTDDKGKENPFREPILDFLKSIKQRIGGGL